MRKLQERRRDLRRAATSHEGGVETVSEVDGWRADLLTRPATIGSGFWGS